MFKFQKHLGLFLFAFVAYSCHKEHVSDPLAPVACFDITQTTPYAKIGITFNSDCSKNAVSYLWDFGDGAGTSLVASPIYTYSKSGTFTVSLTTTNNKNQISKTTKSITVQPSPFIEHSGYIDDNEDWVAGQHLITGNVIIRQGSVKIEPGATIYFNSSKSIFIGDQNTTTAGGALFMAIGTASQPIIFKPASGVSSPGEWGHLYFRDQASSNCSMDYCQILYGGKGGSFDYPAFTYYTNYGIVHVESTGLKITNTKITGGANYGFSVYEKGYFTSFTGNTVTSNTSYPGYIHFNQAHTIGIGNTFDGAGIMVFGQYFSQLSATWSKLNVPYILDGLKNIIVATGSQIGSTLTLQPGVTIAFKKGTYFEVGGTVGTLSLIANGTATDPILFTSAETTKAHGDWVGIEATTTSSFKYCRFEYGGGADSYGYHQVLRAGSVIVSNCTFSESAGTAISLGSGSPSTYAALTFTNIDGYAMEMYASVYHQLTGDHTMTNTKGVLVNGVTALPDGSITWQKLPYKTTLEGDITVGSINGSTLTLAPGTIWYMSPGANFKVGGTSWAPGGLIADGTNSAVTFTTSVTTPASASDTWGTIYFGPGTTTASKLVNCQFNYGGYYGSATTMYDYGMVHCDQTAGAPTISKCTLSNSANYGLYLHQSTAVVTNDNTFTNNAKGNLTN